MKRNRYLTLFISLIPNLMQTENISQMLNLKLVKIKEINYSKEIEDQVLTEKQTLKPQSKPSGMNCLRKTTSKEIKLNEHRRRQYAFKPIVTKIQVRDQMEIMFCEEKLFQSFTLNQIIKKNLSLII